MHALVLAALLARAPFWETKPPQEWTVEEMDEIFSDSPWAKLIALETVVGKAPAVQVYLATARPMQDAEAEARRRRRSKPSEEDGYDEYRQLLAENPGKYIVLAVRLPHPDALSDPNESNRMESETYLQVGKRKEKLVGHFPPTPSDPMLRLIFPQAVEPGDKVFRLELYLPSVPAPYRRVEFYLKELLYQGKPEM